MDLTSRYERKQSRISIAREDANDTLGAFLVDDLDSFHSFVGRNIDTSDTHVDCDETHRESP